MLEFFFFFNDTATTEIYTLSLHDALPILLRKVLVAFGDKVAFEDTLDQALDVLFGGNSGAAAGDNDVSTRGGAGGGGEGEIRRAHPLTPLTPISRIPPSPLQKKKSEAPV